MDNTKPIKALAGVIGTKLKNVVWKIKQYKNPTNINENNTTLKVVGGLQIL